jgi:hypothetical protein
VLLVIENKDNLISTFLRRIVQRRGALGVKRPWVAAVIEQVPKDSLVPSGGGEVDRHPTYI